LFAIDSFCEVGTGDNRSFVLLAHPSCETGVGGVCEGGLIDWSFSELELDWNCVCEHIANTFVLETLPVGCEYGNAQDVPREQKRTSAALTRDQTFATASCQWRPISHIVAHGRISCQGKNCVNSPSF
jgi:hypothetical protein